MTQPQDRRPVAVIVELIDHTAAIAALHDRRDLAERLAAAKVRISDPQIRVVIAGQLKQGKSQLLNSLLNLPVARVGDDETTALITVVSYADQPIARLVVAPNLGAAPGVPEPGAPEYIDIPIDAIRTDLRRAPIARGREVLRVEVGVPSPLLRGGLTFIDTPGVGGHGQPHLSATLGLLPDADAMLMISDTSQEFTEPEMRFLRQGQQLCPVTAVIATKTDLYPHWRAIVAANTAHLQRAGVDVPLIPASSLLRSHAVSTNDAELNTESNFPAIVSFLSERVLSRETDRVRDAVLAEIASTAEHLTLAVDAELAALDDPDSVRRITEDLERRQQDASDALAHTALWQQVLNDGIADLTGDVDHDLRARFREIVSDAEAVIDSCDPTVHWAEIGAQVQDSVATAVGDNFVFAYRRAEALAAEVARTFTEVGFDGVDIPEVNARDMGAEFTGLKAITRLESKPIGFGHKAVTGLRGSYGGVLMFGMLSSVVGLGMFNPLSLGAGLLLGRKAYREDMENRMMRVRSEAKTNLRKFVDDVSFVVGKESRDRLKTIQRQLRDHYRDIANETARSLNESLQATLNAARLEENERIARVNELSRQRNILGQVSDNVVNLRAPR
ncbi:MAG: dynamin-like GTPase family protein [Mycolicibacterium insubricum]|nr:dynamin-like GTPase family protein [Mycobacterium sp.]